MISVRRSEERGEAAFDWLESRHTFSFGSYYDPEYLGFSALRVINDDRVIPGAGFGIHGHRDMEIISYVLDGVLVHKDSEGNEAEVPAGEFQLMSAGSGIEHSEFNGSVCDPLRFLQIWIRPNVQGQPPDYQQKKFGQHPGLTLVASPDGAEGSLSIKQDARVYQLILRLNDALGIETSLRRHYYIHVIDGNLRVNEEKLGPGDGTQVTEVDKLAFAAGDRSVRALVFDLP